MKALRAHYCGHNSPHLSRSVRAWREDQPFLFCDPGLAGAVVRASRITGFERAVLIDDGAGYNEIAAMARGCARLVMEASFVGANVKTATAQAFAAGALVGQIRGSEPALSTLLVYPSTWQKIIPREIPRRRDDIEAWLLSDRTALRLAPLASELDLTGVAAAVAIARWFSRVAKAPMKEAT